MKIVTIVGARPQFIKAAMISRLLSNEKDMQDIILHTGQHYDMNMSQVFFDELEISKVAYQLAIHSTSHGKQTGEMLIAIEDVLMQEKPDWVLIYGDTNSTLAGAVAAAKLHIPIAHVEAGLRSFNRHMPEEVNRIIADQLADVLFTGTAQAVTNLKREGYPEARISEVGDVMYDAALFYAERADKNTKILKELNLTKYMLTTIHRAENTDDAQRLKIIFEALEQLNKHIPIVFPLHPRTRKTLEQHYPTLLHSSKMKIIEPVGFLEMIALEKNSELIITDSGGIQKEAFFYQIPCVTLRDETEWVELIELGWNRLVKPIDSAYIYEQVMQALGTRGITAQHPYGKGNAANKIVERLKNRKSYAYMDYQSLCHTP